MSSDHNDQDDLHDESDIEVVDTLLQSIGYVPPSSPLAPLMHGGYFGAQGDDVFSAGSQPHSVNGSFNVPLTPLQQG